MKYAGKRAAAVLSAVMVAMLMVPSTAAVASNNSSSSCWSYSTAEKGFKRRINNERVNDGISKLHFDPELSKVARRHTNEMISANEKNPNKGLFHSTTEELKNRITNWTMLGENVGVGGTVESLHDAFMDSPPHAENVLHAAYKNIGIGAKRSKDGRLWVTIIFEAHSDPGTTLQMPSC